MDGEPGAPRLGSPLRIQIQQDRVLGNRYRAYPEDPPVLRCRPTCWSPESGDSANCILFLEVPS